MSKKTKVFVVGFHKTGTSSLATALTILGYKVCGAQNHLSRPLINGNLEPFVELAKKYDAFEDDPWPILYKEMDKHFPGSKFILTYRDPENGTAAVTIIFMMRPPPSEIISMATAVPWEMKKILKKCICNILPM